MPIENEIEIMESLKTDWLPTDFYNFEDLNRVELATKIVRDKVALFKGIPIELEYFTERDETHIEFADSLNRIEANIQKLVDTFPNAAYLEPMKTDWAYEKPFSFLDANRYEMNLYFMYKNIEANWSNIPFCGQYIVGQEGVF